MTTQDNSARLSWLLTVASIAIVVGGLYLAKGVLLPFIVAVLISFLLSPICDWMERRRIGRVPAVLASVILTFAVLSTITWVAISQMSDLAKNISQYQNNIEAKLSSVKSYIGTTLQGVKRTKEKLEENMESEPASAMGTGAAGHPYTVRVIPTAPSPIDYFSGMFGPLLEAVGTAGIVLILVLFFLFRREDLRDRFIRLVGQGQVTGTTEALADATSRVSRYLLVQLCINVAFGFVVTVGLYFIGVPNALLWGILTAVFKFIPYIGVWIAAVAPVAVAMAIADGWLPPILAFSLYCVLEFFVGNFLEPILFGKHTGVSAVAILVAAVFWAWLWGGVGLLLATPLTVCLLVIGKHVPQFSFLDTLLGDEPVFEPKIRVYQRLLAGDQEEAVDLIEEHRKNTSLSEVYDTVLIPALCLAEKDRYRGEIDQFRLEFILRSMKGVVEELGDSEEEVRVNAAAAASEQQHASKSDASNADEFQHSEWLEKPKVLSLPAASEADEVAALMLAQVAMDQGFSSQTLSFKAEFRGIVSVIEENDFNLICIAALAPGAVTHARSLCRSLRARFPKTRILIGLLNFIGQLPPAQARIGGGPLTEVFTSLSELETQFRMITEPETVAAEKAERTAAVKEPVPLVAVDAV